MGLLKTEEPAAPQPAGPVHTKYTLHAVIVHLGKSVHSGHYVCYIKKGKEWVLYNDARVCETPEPVL